MNTLLWEVLKDLTHWGQTQKPARTDEVCWINGIGSQGCWAGTKCLFSPDFIYEWFIDWLTDWGLEPANVWSGDAGDQDQGSNVTVCHSAILTFGTSVSIFLMSLIKRFLLVWVSRGSPGNSRLILGLNVMGCCICQCGDICAEPWEGSAVSAIVATWQERWQPC